MKQFYTGLAIFFLVACVVLAYLVFQDIAGFHTQLLDFDDYVTEDEKASERIISLAYLIAAALGTLLLSLVFMTLRNFARVPVVELAEGDLKKIEKAAEDANHEATEQDRIEQERLAKERAAQQAKAEELAETLLKFKGKGSNLTQRSESYLRELANAFSAGQGVFYLRSEAEQLRISATYAFIVEDGQPQTVEYGSGFVGEVARKQTILALEEIPENYLQIFSGLGSSVPTFLIYQPIIHQNEVCGVVELALFATLNSFELEALQKVANHLGGVFYPEVKDRFKTTSPVGETNPTTSS